MPQHWSQSRCTQSMRFCKSGSSRYWTIMILSCSVICSFTHCRCMNKNTANPSWMKNTTPTNTLKIRRRKVFSLRAPTHPVKPMMNMTAPTIIKMRAGSNGMLVSWPIFWNISFSDHAQSPIAQIAPPRSQNTMLKPNTRYFIIQLTSVLSRRRFPRAIVERLIYPNSAIWSNTAIMNRYPGVSQDRKSLNPTTKRCESDLQMKSKLISMKALN